MNKLVTTVSLLFLFSATLVLAQEPDYSSLGIDIKTGPVPQGLKPGDKAPEFSGYDQSGARVNSSKVLESGPIVLFFYQGKWSPSDSKCLNNMQDSLNILTGMGVNVVAVTPESIENVEQTVKLHNLTFTVIYDCQEQIMKDFGLYYNVTKEFSDSILRQYSIDIARNNERAAAHLPVPAVYVINRQGFIVAVWFDPDYKNRASVSWIIKNLASAI